MTASLLARGGRKRFVPEVVQSSMMDCGPAALKSLLDGYGLPASYAALRSYCQTDVDGTSITVIEELAQSLGLDAEQVMLPVENVLLPGFDTLPAIAVVQLANGFTHFVLVWRLEGPLVQIMDPARGRIWLPRNRFLEDLYRHRLQLPAAEWREWAGSESFCVPLALRLEALGMKGAEAEALIASACRHDIWHPLAALEAAERMVSRLVARRAITKGRVAAALVAELYEAEMSGDRTVPESFWTVRPIPGSDEDLVFEAALIVSVAGRLPAAEDKEGSEPDVQTQAGLRERVLGAETAERPIARLWQALSGVRGIAVLAAAVLVLVGLAGMAEIFLIRGVLEARSASDASLFAALMIALSAALLATEFGALRAAHFLGRRLELTLRRRLDFKIPRLGDGYFQSRLASDLAHRAYELRLLRQVPALGAGFLRDLGTTVAVLCAILVVYPAGAFHALLAALIVFLSAFAAQPLLERHEARQRTYAGALMLFNLDGLLGQSPLRAHRGEGALMGEQEALLAEWVRSGRRAAESALGIGALAYAGLLLVAVFLVRAHAGSDESPLSTLLLLYFALLLAVLGQGLFLTARQFPFMRQTALRVLDPLSAPDDERAPAEDAPLPERSALPARAGVGVLMRNVSLDIQDRRLLSSLSFEVAPGEQVALVGASGAGKSSLAGLLLGFNRPSEGDLLVDGEPLDALRLERLRRETVWVDPQVQLWNASLGANVASGNDKGSAEALQQAAALADLAPVLARFADPAETLGEAGRLVSGGEGQRIRFARALARDHVRLAILDEPFRGLDRGVRRRLLATARDRWRGATLLCITHDMEETTAFDRVLVLDNGRLVEDGGPQALLRQNGAYRALVEGERDLSGLIWRNESWDRWQLSDGKLARGRASAAQAQ